LRSVYEERLKERRQALEKLQELSNRLGYWRLAIVAAGAVLAFQKLAFLPIAVGGFVFLAIWHERIARRAERETRGRRFYEQGVERLSGNWSGKGPQGDPFRDPDHPYAEDLDLFGRGSLFERISQARTLSGEETLAQWLKAPASRTDIEHRQQAVRELTPNLDLREDLAMAGEDIRAQVHPDALDRWAALPPVAFFPGARIVANFFVAVTLVLLAGFFLQQLTWHWPVTWLLIQGIFGFILRDKVLRVLSQVELPAHDLGVVAALLERLERERFESPSLNGLRQSFETQGKPASIEIAHLRTLVDRQDWTHNEFFKPFARTTLWSTHLAMAIEQWRQKSGPKVAQWLASIGEIEALSSFASYAAENPEDTWPELVDSGPHFEAEALAHPLIPRERAVANDVRLNDDLRLLLVSGSNMSGKSTLLRSVGLASVMAWAGAPVRAARLRISPLTVGAEMRVQDSLQEGKSRFYAEILRLRQIVELSRGERPLLYLLDEILAGTNSHDRRIGAEAIVASLVRAGAIGLVTTHDLALAAMVENFGQLARNVHFEDHIEDGRIAFDYRMRPGIVTKSNAIELMRSIGLDV
jgi:hypothetical protein